VHIFAAPALLPRATIAASLRAQPHMALASIGIGEISDKKNSIKRRVWHKLAYGVARG